MKRLVLVLLLAFCSAPLWATVGNTPFTVTYTCTGGFGPFAFTFPVDEPSALQVIMNGVLLAPTSYTVAPTNNNYTNGGKVTLGASFPCTAGWVQLLSRNTPITQNISFNDNMPIPMKTFERGLDKLTEIDQEIWGRTLHSLFIDQNGGQIDGPCVGTNCTLNFINCTVTGSAPAFNISCPGTPIIDSTYPWINAGGFAGADIGAQVNAASATCGIGTPCHITIPALGQQTFNTTITYVPNMTLECSPSGAAAEQTGGAAVPTLLKYTGSGTAIDFNGVSQPVLRNCSLDMSGSSGSAVGVKVTGSSPVVEYNYFIGGPVGTKVVNIGLSDGAQFNGNSAFEFLGDYLYINNALDVHATSNVAYGARIGGGLSNTTSRTVVIDSGSSGIHFKTFDGGSAGLHGLEVLNSTGTPPSYLFFDDFISDCSYGDGWFFDSTLSLFSVVYQFSNSWAAGSGQNCDGTTAIRSVAQGIHISGGDGMTFDNMVIRGSAYNGMLIDNGLVQDITVTNSKIYGNNVANNSDAHGIYTSAFVNGFKAVGNTITNSYQSLPNGNQRYGIKIGANGENMNITGNNLGNNITGPILYPNSFGINVVGNTNNNTPMDSVNSGNIGAVGVASHGQGGWLIPQFGTSAGFLMGLGINMYFDGTNFHLPTDTTNNGGGGWLGDEQGDVSLYSVPTNGTPASDQTISAASLASHKVVSVTSAGWHFSAITGSTQCLQVDTTGLVAGTGSACGSGGGGSGTVTTFSAGTLSPLFTTSVASPTSTPALSFTLSNAAAGTIFGNFTTGSANPSFTSFSVSGTKCYLFTGTGGQGCDSPTGTGTVTHTAGALTLNAGMFGNGAADSKVDTNITTDGSGNETVASLTTSSGPVTVGGTSHFIDVPEQAAPANPAAATERWYGDSSTHKQSCLTSSGGNCAPSGGGTRTYLFTFQGVCQAGAASMSINLPTVNSVGYVACDATHVTPEVQAGASTTQSFWIKLPVPAGHTGTYSSSEVWRSAATTGTATITRTYACVAAGAVPDNPSYGALDTVTFTPAGTTLQNVLTTQSSLTMTCADNADLYVNFSIATTSLGSGSGTLNISRIQFSVQGSL